MLRNDHALANLEKSNLSPSKIQIPGLNVENLGNVSTPSRGEKIQHPSKVEEFNEEDKIQKMYSSQSTSQTDRETISYSNPIYSSLTIPQTTIGLSEYQSQQIHMSHGNTDRLSRLEMSRDYQLNKAVFQRIQK
jgi:hypothetical protein